MFYHIFQLPSSKKISVTKKETFLVIRHVYQTPHLNAKLRFFFLICKGSQISNTQNPQRSTCLGGQDNTYRDSPYSYFTAWELQNQLQESANKVGFPSETNVISSSFFSPIPFIVPIHFYISNTVLLLHLHILHHKLQATILYSSDPNKQYTICQRLKELSLLKKRGSEQIESIQTTEDISPLLLNTHLEGNKCEDEKKSLQLLQDTL